MPIQQDARALVRIFLLTFDPQFSVAPSSKDFGRPLIFVCGVSLLPSGSSGLSRKKRPGNPRDGPTDIGAGGTGKCLIYIGHSIFPPFNSQVRLFCSPFAAAGVESAGSSRFVHLRACIRMFELLNSAVFCKRSRIPRSRVPTLRSCSGAKTLNSVPSFPWE